MGMDVLNNKEISHAAAIFIILEIKYCHTPTGVHFQLCMTGG